MGINPDENIAVAKCSSCGLIPVFREKVRLSDILEDGTDEEMIVVCCPGCGTILNINGDVKLEFYALRDIETITGWQIGNNEL